jgi:hypothetical protein
MAKTKSARPVTRGQVDYIWQQMVRGRPITAEQFVRVAQWAYNEMPEENRQSAVLDLFKQVTRPGGAH